MPFHARMMPLAPGLRAFIERQERTQRLNSSMTPFSFMKASFMETALMQSSGDCTGAGAVMPPPGDAHWPSSIDSAHRSCALFSSAACSRIVHGNWLLS